MEKPKITAWLKPSCGWSGGVRAVFKKYELPFEERDVINRLECFEEMVARTGQTKQPCVEINGHMLADVSGQEVEAWMLQNGVVKPNDIEPEAPIDRACANERHPTMGAPLGFRRG
jgi:glutaredoxin